MTRLRWLPAVLLLVSTWATARGADPLPAAVNLAEVDDDYFFQGEFAGNVWGYGRVGLQLIAEGAGTFRAVLLPGGLPGDGGDRNSAVEFKGKRDASSVVLADEEYAITATLGYAVVRDRAGRQLGHLTRMLRQSPTMGQAPPRGARVLFNGSSTDEFADGKISPAGYLMHGATTKRPYGDFHLHLEFKLPYMPTARGQARGNSGVYIQRRYEVQILDSFGLPGEANECGGLYKTKRPDVNMCLPPLVWQTYDIDFTAARFNAQGKKTADARVTVVQNGVTVQNYYALPNKTGGGQPEGPAPLPILLQNHGNPVEFRNVWIVER